MSGRSRRTRPRKTVAWAEESYNVQYSALRDAVSEADTLARSGQWSEASIKWTVALSAVANLIGTCRELHVLYQYQED